MPKGVPNKRYTPEFKRMVVETMKKEHLSIYAAMQEFGINDHKIIERWERIYLEEGPEGLSVERRGRSSTGRSKKLPKEVEEDLLAEVQRLRAENDYLKNLQALVLEDERRQHKKRWCAAQADSAQNALAQRQGRAESLKRPALFLQLGKVCKCRRSKPKAQRSFALEQQKAHAHAGRQKPS